MVMVIDTPRLSTALQAFGDCLVSSDEAPASLSLHEKRAFMRRREQERLVTWSKLQAFVREKAPSAFGELRRLYHQIVAIVGTDAESELLENLPFALLCQLESEERWSLRLLDKVKGVLGPVEPSAAQKLHATVQGVARAMSTDVRAELLALDPAGYRASSNGALFGQGIRFHFNTRPRLSSCTLSDDDAEAGSRMEDVMASCAVAGPTDSPQKAAQNGAGSVDRAWLAERVAPFSPRLGIPAEQLVERTAAVLLSERCNEAIQDELFGLLGDEGFDLIGELLNHRAMLIDSCPGPGRVDSIEFATNGGVVAALSANPAALAERRERQLAEGPQMPKPRPGGSVPSAKAYPYVFDSLMEVTQSAAYISSQKIHLPKEHTRRSNRLSEEVRFPPSRASCLEQYESRFPRVPISKLDDVARLAFGGMKELNLIQSIVFESAYKSNENLLVCAPTGAGKTNVALLTIVHEIKQHIGPGGVVRKDDFKIIYVAPMKALAAEMARNFGRRLEPLGISVRECTGDMQLSKAEILRTQMLVVTPEKWDVMTRKSTGDVSLVQIVKLLIIDEVHLLHEDRGAVIESLVARTLRQVEMSQRMIRIVGLSATLPNYTDVAAFLRVNPSKGLFFFDHRFRPVPLGQAFVGVRTKNNADLIRDMNQICYDLVLEQVRQGEQVMVFVHARQETKRTGFALREMAQAEGTLTLFMDRKEDAKTMAARKLMARSRNGPLKDLFECGFAIHHAGMLRSDRNIVERLFSEGHIRCLICTATLAWGVNLPAHAVIIKGTQIYDAEKSSFVDLGILDVLQIFGRAGRPQFDRVGYGTIITQHEKLGHYLSLMCRANPIESQFISSLTDNLNAEIALGSVTNLEEAVKWLSYTYLYVRMRVNPMAYGISYQTKAQDPLLRVYRRDLIISAARQLDKARMVRFDERTEYLAITDLGRTASHFYIKYPTVEVVNELLHPQMSMPELINLVAHAREFSQVKVREEEMEELQALVEDCPYLVRLGIDQAEGKVNVLIQTFISRGSITSFSLISDQQYVQQNAARIVRALFEVALRRGFPLLAGRLLDLSKSVEKQVWADAACPMLQFAGDLRPEVMSKVERMPIDRLLDCDLKELGRLIRDQRAAGRVRSLAEALPRLQLEASLQPITRTILRVRLLVTPDFRWSDRHSGMVSEPFWVWVEDPDNDHIYHYEYFLLTRKAAKSREQQALVFTIPVFEPLPSQYLVRIVSDRWLGCESVLALSFQHLILPQSHPPHSELLDLNPLPVGALKDPKLEALYRFSHFNPIQTQIFHALYYSDTNLLLGAPTGSGKTVAAELAIFRVFREHPGKRCVYIAPLKALVRERMEDWKLRFEEKLGKRVVELTGDVTPDMRAVSHADLIVTTPEKWDGVSRSWQQRSFVQDVALLVIDEIHLLGDERGPVLEVIVSRTNFISSHTAWPVRVVGLSTALANARDLANWLGIRAPMGMFNFRPSVRPVPLEVHIQGFAGRHYCPRMATMNKPIFQAIRTHSPAQPTLVFVSSRRQTRLTALDLIAYLAAEDDPKQWLAMDEAEIDALAQGVRDSNLRLTLAFGIGLHHAGLHERDRKLVEGLFVSAKIQVLVATSTLAWGVNFPAHLVIVKGTEFFDGKTKRYVDYPITDVLQMMGRAGRPQFDTEGKAVIMVHDIKKHFYKRFLYEPFPVESNLLSVLPDHLNAEIVAGTVSSKQEAVDYITWTYFFRRLVMNPTYYDLENTDHDVVNHYLSKLVEKCVFELESSHCVAVEEDGNTLSPQPLGRIASYYYLTHETVRLFRDRLRPNSTQAELLQLLADTKEYATLPVRHNEDQLNAELAKQLPLPVDPYSMDSSHTKTNLLLQAHFCRQQLPLADYVTDTKSVLDQAIRILQAMIDASAEQGWLATSLRSVQLIQMLLQGRWLEDSPLLTLPNLEDFYLKLFHEQGIYSIPELIEFVGDRPHRLRELFRDSLSRDELDRLFHTLRGYPVMEVSMAVRGTWEEGGAETRNVRVNRPGTRAAELQWFDVHADDDYTLEVRLRKVNSHVERRAVAPKFPKPKDEGWVLFLGEVDAGELWAVKRVPVVRQALTTVPLAFISPPEPGRCIYTLYVMSDCYLGFDQQFDVCLNVLPERSKPEDEEEQEEQEEQEERRGEMVVETSAMRPGKELEEDEDEEEEFYKY